MQDGIKAHQREVGRETPPPTEVGAEEEGGTVVVFSTGHQGAISQDNLAAPGGTVLEDAPNLGKLH